MKIDLNKDFDTQFKNEVWRGFTGRELLFGAIALAVGALVTVTVWWVTKLPINVCVYFGVPFIALIGAGGLLNYQGKSIIALIKEIRYFLKTQRLPSRMAERGENADRIFSTKQKEERRTKNAGN